MSAETLATLQRQHQEVLDRFVEFSRQLSAADQRAATVESLLGVITEISMHFGFEEALMEAGAFVDFEHHRRQHIGIITELALLLDRVEANNATSELVRGADFLLHWYQEHIANTDRLMEDWLRSRS